MKCKTCFRLGCPAVTIEDDKVVVVAEMCWGCGLCAQVCPKSAIGREEAGQ